MTEKKALPQIETLVRSSFERFKSRFVSYLLSVGISFGLGIVVGLVIALIALLHVFIFMITQSVAFTATTAVILGSVLIAALIYVSAWGQLASIEAIIGKEQKGIIQIFKDLRPAVWGYVWYAVASTFFLLGIFLFGLAGFVIPGIILMILWSFWNSFSAFIYLEHRYRGLENLWASYRLINKNFWGLFGRMIVVYLVAIIIVISFSYFASEYNAGNLLTTLVNLVITPFLLAYLYELYRHAGKVESKQSSTVWTIIAILGWVFVIGGILFFWSLISQALPGVLDEMERQNIMQTVQLI